MGTVKGKEEKNNRLHRRTIAGQSVIVIVPAVTGKTTLALGVVFWGTTNVVAFVYIKGVAPLLHLWTLFLKTLCIFSTNKVNLNKVSNGSALKCSKELKNYRFISVETIVVTKL